jgi:hypothetical protein
MVPVPIRDGMTQGTWTSRAVVRIIEAGSATSCAACGAPIKFQVRVKGTQVICNVYEDQRWARVEHYHEDCYLDAGSPHGEPDTSQPLRQKRRPVAVA